MARNRAVYFTILVSLILLAIVFRNYHTEMAVKVVLIVTVIFDVICFISVRQVNINFGKKCYEAIISDTLDIELCVENYGLFPIQRLDIVYDVVYSRSGMETYTERVNLMPNRETTIQIKHKTTRVGATIFRIRAIYAYDFFECFRKKKSMTEYMECYIYPRDMSDKIRIKQRVVEVDDDNAVYSTVKPGNDKSELFAIREYIPGDNVKNIHWKLSARGEEVLVKEFSLPLKTELYLVPQVYEGDVAEEKDTKNWDKIDNCHYELFFALSKALANMNVKHYVYVNGMSYVVENADEVMEVMSKVLKSTLYNHGVGEEEKADYIKGEVIYLCRDLNTQYFERIKQIAEAGIKNVILTGTKENEMLVGIEAYVNEMGSKFIFNDINSSIDDMEMVEF